MKASNAFFLLQFLDLIEELRRPGDGIKWVGAHNLHLTLKFLGEQPSERVNALDGAVPAALSGLAAVTVRLGGGGFFPNERRPRVAWVGGSAPGLDSWARAVEDSVAGLGVEREARPFSLHLTLARLERPWGVKAVEHFLVEVGKWRFPEFVARELVLFESELTPAGAVYTPRRRWAVGS